MPYGRRMLMEAVRTLAFGSVAAGYTAVGTATTNPGRIIFVQNLTNATLMFSIDGTTDHFPLPANGFLLLDIASDKQASDPFFLGAVTTLYVKQVGVPTTGNVYFTLMYGLGDL